MSRRRAFMLPVLLFGSIAACSDDERSPGQPPTPDAGVRVTTLVADGGRVDWSRRRNLILFDRAGADGYFDVYRMNPDGSGQVCLTCDRPGFPSRHLGNPAWHPSGDWVVFQAQKVAVTGPGIDFLANPGAGLNNDLWIMDSAATRVWRLTNVPVGTGGVLHPVFSHGGNRLLWSERIDNGGRYGEWALRLADFNVSGGEPRIDNVRTLRPGDRPEFYETHGFTPDDRQIVFSANAAPGQDALFIDIYRLDLQSNALTNLTPAAQEWDEHAQVSPGGGRIVWMSSRGLPPPSTPEGVRTDYWMMNADGSAPRRITFFNDPSSSQFIAGGAVAADGAWSPDGSRMVAYVILNPARVQGRIVMLDFGAPQPLTPAAQVPAPAVPGSERGPEQGVRDEPALVEAASDTLADLRSWDAAIDSMLRSRELARTIVMPGSAEPGHVIERFAQYHDGVPVLTAEAVRQIRRGQTVSISARLFTRLESLRAVPTRSEEDAARDAMSRGRFVPASGEPALVWLPRGGGLQLVYRVRGARTDDVGAWYVGARGESTIWSSDVPHREGLTLSTAVSDALVQDRLPAVLPEDAPERGVARCAAAADTALSSTGPGALSALRIASARAEHAAPIRYLGRQLLIKGQVEAGSPGDTAHAVAHALLDAAAGSPAWTTPALDEPIVRLLSPAVASACTGLAPEGDAVARVLYRALRLMPRAGSARLTRAAAAQAAGDLFGRQSGFERTINGALTAAGLR